LTGCGPDFDIPTSENAEAPQEWGHAAFALTAESAEKAYALRDARFSVTGAETVTLDSGDSPNAPTLVRELPSGPYSVELQSGYKLVEVTDVGDIEVQATLETTNPQSILVSPDQVTSVTFLFRTSGAPVEFGPGSLAIAIQVEKADAAGLVISEFMVNPSAVSDSDGEWIEITNTADQALSLQGCRLLRDGSGFTIETAVSIAPGGVVVLANGESPGFSPGYVYSGVTLPNSTAFTLSLECGGTVIDTVPVAPDSFPLASGISATLGSAAMSSSRNDIGGAWCLATKAFGADFGTPGEVNDACGN
jgi:hypothetical protein